MHFCIVLLYKIPHRYLEVWGYNVTKWEKEETTCARRRRAWKSAWQTELKLQSSLICLAVYHIRSNLLLHWLWGHVFKFWSLRLPVAHFCRECDGSILYVRVTPFFFIYHDNCVLSTAPKKPRLFPLSLAFRRGKKINIPADSKVLLLSLLVSRPNVKQ